MATSLSNLFKEQYGPHPLGDANGQLALVGLFTTSFHGRGLFNPVMGDLRQSSRFKQGQRNVLQGVFTAEEAVRLVMDLQMPKRHYKKLITLAQKKSKAAEQILGGGWINSFRSYRAMHNAWKRLCKYQKMCVVTLGEYLGVEWKVASFLKYIATQPDIIDRLHLEEDKP